MTDTNTKDVETQKPNGDSASICSTVKTPLVDALRSYFGIGIKEEVIVLQESYNVVENSIREIRLGFNNG